MRTAAMAMAMAMAMMPFVLFFISAIAFLVVGDGIWQNGIAAN